MLIVEWRMMEMFVLELVQQAEFALVELETSDLVELVLFELIELVALSLKKPDWIALALQLDLLVDAVVPS
jgi:hypothetical protein